MLFKAKKEVVKKLQKLFDHLFLSFQTIFPLIVCLQKNKLQIMLLIWSTKADN